jgi:hypothetical protein
MRRITDPAAWRGRATSIVRFFMAGPPPVARGQNNRPRRGPPERSLRETAAAEETAPDARSRADAEPT